PPPPRAHPLSLHDALPISRQLLAGEATLAPGDPPVCVSPHHSLDLVRRVPLSTTPWTGARQPLDCLRHRPARRQAMPLGCPGPRAGRHRLGTPFAAGRRHTAVPLVAARLCSAVARTSADSVVPAAGR